MLGIPEHPGCLSCIVYTELHRKSCTQGTGIGGNGGIHVCNKCNFGYFMIPFLNSRCCSGKVKVWYGNSLFSCPPRTSLLRQDIRIPLNPFVASTRFREWRKHGHEGNTSKKAKLTLAILEFNIIFIIQAWLISSGKGKLFVVWGGNAREVNGGEGLDVKGMCVIIHGWQIHGADSKIHGPKRHFCVNHCNPCKQQQEKGISEWVVYLQNVQPELRSKCPMSTALRWKL